MLKLGKFPKVDSLMGSSMALRAMEQMCSSSTSFLQYCFLFEGPPQKVWLNIAHCGKLPRIQELLTTLQWPNLFSYQRKSRVWQKSKIWPVTSELQDVDLSPGASFSIKVAFVVQESQFSGTNNALAHYHISLSKS